MRHLYVLRREGGLDIASRKRTASVVACFRGQGFLEATVRRELRGSKNAAGCFDCSVRDVACVVRRLASHAWLVEDAECLQHSDGTASDLEGPPCVYTGGGSPGRLFGVCPWP
jgi:hypothetical protein